MEQESNLESLFSKTVECVDTRLNIFKLKTIENFTHIASSIVWRLAVILVSVFALLFINIGVSFWLGDIFGKIYYGFLIIGIFYLLTGLLLYLLRNKWIKKPTSNLIVKKISTRLYDNF